MAGAGGGLPITSSSTSKPAPKRFVRSQIPDSIFLDEYLNAAISLLPSNYNFEVHKCVWRLKSQNAKRVALQLPEGLLMYSLHLSDIFRTFAGVHDCFILGDVTYGACCVDDLSAVAMNADFLIHYGHSCLVPIDLTTVPCLYVFVDIKIDVDCLSQTVDLNLNGGGKKRIVLAGTIQFASAIREAKPALEAKGFNVLIPQSKPLSAGEVLGCTAPKVLVSGNEGTVEETVAVFVADGRFHLEAFMIANPWIKTFRYDPYMKKLFLEEYDHKGMKDVRRNAVEKAKGAQNWGLILGSLGRQGNPRTLERLEAKMLEKGLCYTVFLMSEISPSRIALFEDCVDAWIQIACPRLSIDWGDAFNKPLLTSFEAEIALGDFPGWWEARCSDSDCGKKGTSCCGNCVGLSMDKEGKFGGSYPMDYYAQDGGVWNSSYRKKNSRPPSRRIETPSLLDVNTS